MLGLGLGLSKGKNLLSNLKLLTRNSDWAIWGDKATGTSKGVNSPATNPIQDLVENADGTLQGFAFTTASGYVDVPIKGVGDEISYSNLVTNGDFAQGTTGWLVDNASISVTSNTLISTGTGGTSVALVYQDTATVSTIGKRIYFKIKCKVTNSVCESIALNVDGTISGTDQTINQDNPVINIVYPMSYIVTQPANVSGVIRVKFQHSYADAATANGKVMEVQQVQAINLTDNPQIQALESKLGRQLTAAECDYLFDFTATTNTIKAKVVTGIQGDGANDVILLPSNAPNPTSGNFAFGLIVKTGANKVKYLLTRNVTNDADTQYAFKFDASGNLFVILEGVAIQIGTALSIGFHSVWLERDSGTLKAFIDGVETYSGAHSTTLTSRANAVMMASTTGTGTYTGFSNDILLASKYCDSGIATNRADWFKFDTKVYGL